MSEVDLSKLSDKELLDEAKNNKPSPLMDAFFIGVLIGIIVFGLIVNSLGFWLLAPLFLIFLMQKKPRRYAALQKEIRSRGLDPGQG